MSQVVVDKGIHVDYVTYIINTYRWVDTGKLIVDVVIFVLDRL